MSPTTTHHRTDESILEHAGFTPVQIVHLQALREIYPLPEFLETGQIRRLAFMKWELLRRATTTPDQSVS